MVKCANSEKKKTSPWYLILSVSPLPLLNSQRRASPLSTNHAQTKGPFSRLSPNWRNLQIFWQWNLIIARVWTTRSRRNYSYSQVSLLAIPQSLVSIFTKMPHSRFYHGRPCQWGPDSPENAHYTLSKTNKQNTQTLHIFHLWKRDSWIMHSASSHFNFI